MLTWLPAYPIMCAMRLPVRVADRTIVPSVVGVLGSILMTVASFGAGSTPAAVTDETRFAAQLAHPWYAVGLALWFAGAALLGAAWWRLGRLIRDGEVGGRRLAVTAVLWAVPFLFSAPMASRDVYAYALQGLLYDRGFDPYAVGPAVLTSPWIPAMSAFWLHSPTPYGPLAVLISGAAAGLSGGHLLVAVGWLRLSALVGVVLTAVHLPRLARAGGADPVLAAWLGVASPLVFVQLLSSAHHDALTLGLLVAGLDLAARRRGWPAGVVLGLAAAVKATAIIAVPFAAVLATVAYAGRWRTGRGALVVALPAVGVFVALSLAGGLGPGWLRAAPGANSVIHWLSLPTAVGMVLGGLAGLAGLPHALNTVVPAVRIAGWYVLLPVLLVVLWWRVRTSTDPRRIVTAAGWALAVAVLLSPLVYPWYYVAPVAILAAVVDRDRVRLALAALTLFGVFVILPDGINLAHMTKWPGSVVVVTALVALAGWWWFRRRRSGPAASIPAPRSPSSDNAQVPVVSTDR